METSRCPQCNAPAHAEGKFCSHCGANLHTATVPNQMLVAATPPVAPAPVVQMPQQQMASYPSPQPYQPAPQPSMQPQTYQQPYVAPQAVQTVNVVMGQPGAPVVLVNQKSVGVALVLTFFFGPLGMLYSTVSGGLIMLVVSVVLSFLTLGFSILITWPICMIWGAVAASNHNKAIIARA